MCGKDIVAAGKGDGCVSIPSTGLVVHLGNGVMREQDIVRGRDQQGEIDAFGGCEDAFGQIVFGLHGNKTPCSLKLARNGQVREQTWIVDRHNDPCDEWRRCKGTQHVNDQGLTGDWHKAFVFYAKRRRKRINDSIATTRQNKRSNPAISHWQKPPAPETSG